MQLNYLLMRPSCNLIALEKAFRFAEQYDLEFRTDLIHYSLPYFTDGPNHELQFRGDDRPAIIEWVNEFAKLKVAYPNRIKESLLSIYSIPDWVLKGPDMKVPC